MLLLSGAEENVNSAAHSIYDVLSYDQQVHNVWDFFIARILYKLTYLLTTY